MASDPRPCVPLVFLSPRPTLPSVAASADAILSSGPGVPFSDFALGVKRFGLTGAAAGMACGRWVHGKAKGIEHWAPVLVPAFLFKLSMHFCQHCLNLTSDHAPSAPESAPSPRYRPPCPLPADALRQASRGKALVVPTNAALSTRFVKLGLYKQPGHIPATAIDAFKTLVHSGVAVKRVRETGS